MKNLREVKRGMKSTPHIEKLRKEVKKYEDIIKKHGRNSGFGQKADTARIQTLHAISIYQDNLSRKNINENRTHDRNLKHKAVESIDDGGPGEYFVNLKKGWEWSQQRSFGVKNATEAARYLKEVEKTVTEDAPANATGASVPGSGDTGQVFGKKQKVYRAWDKRRGKNKPVRVLKRFIEEN